WANSSQSCGVNKIVSAGRRNPRPRRACSPIQEYRCAADANSDSAGAVKRMNQVVGDWKYFHQHQNKVTWQEGSLIIHCATTNEANSFKARSTTRQNAVVAGLCSKAENWPWMINPTGS